jgi:hypothetical protein
MIRPESEDRIMAANAESLPSVPIPYADLRRKTERLLKIAGEIEAFASDSSKGLGFDPDFQRLKNAYRTAAIEALQIISGPDRGVSLFPH